MILQAGAMAAAAWFIDADPGKFSDDSAAIVTCLRNSARMSVKGITVVSGNVWARDGSRYVRETLRAVGRHPPVHLGSQRPLVHTPEMAKRQGELEFAGAFGEPEPQPGRETAVDWLIGELERRSASILAIGPLTNIARMLEKKPAIAARIEKLVIMGGAVDVPGNVTKAAEFNFWFDPEAAQMVFASPVRKILAPLDVCNKAVVDKRRFDEVAAVDTPVARLYRESFGNGYPGFLTKPDARTYLWDELAAAYALDPSIAVKVETRRLDVVTELGPRYGAVVQGPHAVEVLLEADTDRAWEMTKAALIRK